MPLAKAYKEPSVYDLLAFGTPLSMLAGYAPKTVQIGASVSKGIPIQDLKPEMSTLSAILNQSLWPGIAQGKGMSTIMDKMKGYGTPEGQKVYDLLTSAAKRREWIDQLLK